MKASVVVWYIRLESHFKWNLILIVNPDSHLVFMVFWRINVLQDNGLMGAWMLPLGVFVWNLILIVNPDSRLVFYWIQVCIPVNRARCNRLIALSRRTFRRVFIERLHVTSPQVWVCEQNETCYRLFVCFSGVRVSHSRCASVDVSLVGTQHRGVRDTHALMFSRDLENTSL